MREPWYDRGVFMHCMGGWRAVFCVLDNLTPHRHVRDDEDPGFISAEGRRGFRWACRLHTWVGNIGTYASG